MVLFLDLRPASPEPEMDLFLAARLLPPLDLDLLLLELLDDRLLFPPLLRRSLELLLVVVVVLALLRLRPGLPGGLLLQLIRPNLLRPKPNPPESLNLKSCPERLDLESCNREGRNEISDIKRVYDCFFIKKQSP